MSEVVLTSKEKGWHPWAVQFDKSSRNRHHVDFRGSRPGRSAILYAYRTAARRTGANGLLIVSAGHGFSKGFTSGAVDLAPGGTLRLDSAHFKHRNNLTKARDKEIMKRFEAIGTIIRANRVRRVLFLSCSVGISWDFLQKIANEWRATIGAYRGLLDVGYDFVKKGKHKKYRYYIYLSDKPPRTEADKAYAAINYPKTKFGDAWWVRPRH